jgi:uncharacterized repeat protein (TIGR01451 family)
MKKVLVVILVLLLGLGIAMIPPASATSVGADDGVVSLNEADNGGTVDLRGDQELVIDLEGNLSTGYMWEVASVDGAVLQRVGQFEFEHYSDAVGSAGRQTLRFRAAGEGQTDLVLAYRRSWEDAAPVRTYAVGVQTSGPLSPIDDVYTGAVPPSPARDVGPIGSDAAPADYNWCSSGGCTPVKDQGYCGSCWAFATSGVVESLIKMSDGVERDLAEQYLVSCNIDGWGCAGGGRAFDYFIDKYAPAELAAGAVYETDYPYLSGTDGITRTCTGSPHTKHENLISWGYVGGAYPSVAQIQQAIQNYGPVYVSMCAGPSFEAYTGGVFNTEESSVCGGGTNHGVVLVGWDDSQGSSGVWYLRNSWGTGWGETLAGGGGGYMRIEYGTSNVGRAAAYAVYQIHSNVGIVKDVVGSDFAPGDPVTFTLTIENSGSAVAAGVVVTDVVPAEVLTPTFSSTLAITPTGVVSYVWQVEPLLASDSGVITIYGWIDPSLPSDFSFTNQATISDPKDVTPGNNTSSVTVGEINVYLPLVLRGYPPPSWVTILSEDFEGSFPGSTWSVGDGNPNSGSYYWGKRNCRNNGGSYSAWSVGAGDTILSCGSNYPNDVIAWMEYGPFSLADASAAELSFDWWSDTELNYDLFFWGASSDGFDFYGMGVTGDWSSWTTGEVLDLSAVPGLGNLLGDDSVWIIFIFDSDDMITDRGTFVDNILLRKYADGAAASAGVELIAPLPTPGPGQTIEFTSIRLDR